MKADLTARNLRAFDLITNWYFRLLALAVVSGILLSSYLNYAYTEGVSNQLDDAGTTCNPKLEGIGIHCFSDFYLPMNLSNLDSPWSVSNVPYPPLGLAIFKPFAYLHSRFPGHLSLILYLLFAFVVMLMSAYYFSHKLELSRLTSSLIFLVIIISAPTITILDRGNNTFLIFPALLYMTLNLDQEKRNKFIVAGIFIVLLKPQFILLGTIFLVLKEWRNLAIWFSSSISSILISFLFYPMNIVSNFLHWAYHLFLFQEYTAFGERYPINLSLNSLIEIYFKMNGIEIYRAIISIIVLLCLICSIFILYHSRKYRSQLEIFTLVSMMPILFVGTAFHYYLLVLLIPLLFIIAQAFKKVHMNAYDISNFVSSKTKIVVLIATFTCCLLPWSISSAIFTKHETAVGQNISATWELARICLVAVFIFLVSFAVKPRKKDIESFHG